MEGGDTVPDCPNCGQPTSRTKDWVCQWCGYPMMKGKPVKKFMSPNTPPMLPIIPRDEVIGTNIIDIIKNR